MRRKLAAGNWKMNGTAADLAEFVRIMEDWPDPGVELVVCPPATLVSRMAARAEGHPVRIGGQDCHAEAKGAHTGDVSAQMLADAGASHVIVGHSERRADHGETDAVVRAKAAAAISAGLVPILCLGETLEEREAGRTLEVIAGQLSGSLPPGAKAGEIVIAYEPVWAIGTGKVPTTEQIGEVHGALRRQLMEIMGEEEGIDVRLLYGGSVKGSNAEAIFEVADVDGALVGGASLTAEQFSPIVAALEATARDEPEDDFNGPV